MEEDEWVPLRIDKCFKLTEEQLKIFRKICEINQIEYKSFVDEEGTVVMLRDECIQNFHIKRYFKYIGIEEGMSVEK